MLSIRFENDCVVRRPLNEFVGTGSDWIAPKLIALYRPMVVPAFLNLGTAIIIGTTLVHFLFVAFAGGLPRTMGWLLAVAYGVFVYIGIGR